MKTNSRLHKMLFVLISSVIGLFILSVMLYSQMYSRGLVSIVLYVAIYYFLPFYVFLYLTKNVLYVGLRYIYVMFSIVMLMLLIFTYEPIANVMNDDILMFIYMSTSYLSSLTLYRFIILYRSSFS